MKLLVTGATGFLGSHAVRRWVRDGHHVVATIRPGSDRTRVREIDARIEWLVIQPGNELTDEAFAGVDAVVHFAAAYGRRGETPREMAETNTVFPLGLLHHAAQRGVARFLHSDTALPAATNAYALSKSHFAAWGRAIAAGGAIQFLNLRLEHLYGPGDDELKFTGRVIAACQRHEPELKLTTGEQQRDFIHVDDAVAAMDLLLRSEEKFPGGSVDIPIGSGRTTSLRELVTMIHEIAGSRTALRFGAIAAAPNDVKFSCADLTFLRARGWAPRFELRAGLEQTMRTLSHA